MSNTNGDINQSENGQQGSHLNGSKPTNRNYNNNSNNNNSNKRGGYYRNDNRLQDNRHHRHHNDYNESDRRNNQQRIKKPHTNENGPDPEPPTKPTRSKLISISSNSSSISCICCLHELNTYVYYSCFHYVCLNCAVKMRVLCDKKDCPVCRQESKHVICSKKLLENKLSMEDMIGKLSLICDNKSGIYFDDEEIIKNEYNEILSHKCNLCPNRGSMQSFEDLNTHLRKIHRRFYCDLCIDNLKLFPYERKHYSREELAMHNRIGDKDDFSFKGHPLCEYCDVRFFDKDELYRHFRKDHYYCHFCDSDGHEEYYNDYSQLRIHFLKSHYLCELDGCSCDAATTHEYVVFRSELDFQAHKKQKHAKTKHESKSFAKLNIEFNINNSARDRPKNRRNMNGASSNVDDEPRHSRNHQDIDENVLRASRDQYYRDEQERLRQQQAQRLREQYQKYEQTMSSQTEAVVAGTASAAPVAGAAAASPTSTVQSQLIPDPEPVEEVKPVVSQSTSSWSNLIGSGPAPKFKIESEFPSLSGDAVSSGPGKFLSLASLGESIISSSSKASKNNPWASKTIKPQTEQAALKAASKAVRNNPPQSNSLANSSYNSTSSDNFQVLLPKNSPKQQAIKPNIPESDKNNNIVNKNQNVETEAPKKEKSKKKKEKKEANQAAGATAAPPVAPPVEEIKPETDQAPPPGFGKKPASKNDASSSAPPGFESKPPGLHTAYSSSNLLASSDFIKPDNYDTRNQDLTSSLFLLFGHYYQSEFDKFKSFSAEFRKSSITASEYLKNTQKLLDLPTTLDTYSQKKNQDTKETHLKFLELVQEMIVLLPDTKKQLELYQAYSALVETDQSSKKNKQPWGSSGVVSKIKKCDFCEQYFLNNEMNMHQFIHHSSELAQEEKKLTKAEASNENNEDFPALAPPVAQQPISQPKKGKAATSIEEFPPLASVQVNTENRFSTLPTSTIFSNPNSHLSLVNRKKHRLQK